MKPALGTVSGDADLEWQLAEMEAAAEDAAAAKWEP